MSTFDNLRYFDNVEKLQLSTKKVSNKRVMTSEAKNIMDATMRMVCDIHGVSVDVARVKSRKREIKIIRHIFYYLILSSFDSSIISSPMAGAYLSQDHATALHGKKVISRDMETNKRFEKRMKSIIHRYNKTIVDHVMGRKTGIIPHNELQKLRKELDESERRCNEVYYQAMKILKKMPRGYIEKNHELISELRNMKMKYLKVDSELN